MMSKAGGGPGGAGGAAAPRRDGRAARCAGAGLRLCRAGETRLLIVIVRIIVIDSPPSVFIPAKSKPDYDYEHDYDYGNLFPS